MQRTFIDVNDINCTCRFDDKVQGVSTVASINRALAESHPHVHNGTVYGSYRDYVEPVLRRSAIENTEKRVIDGVLALYPVHLQIQARGNNACPPLKKLSSEVAHQALLLADKYKDDPIFPSAIASIRALQRHAAQNPNFKARHTLLTFGDDGQETWEALAKATGIKLDGTGKFTGHKLTLADGRTFATPQSIFALLKSGNFVLKADFDYWGRQPGRGKLVPVSDDPNVLVHFKDDNLKHAIAAPVHSSTGEPADVKALMADGTFVNVDPLEVAADDSAFITAINRACRSKGWDLVLPALTPPSV